MKSFEFEYQGKSRREQIRAFLVYKDSTVWSFIYNSENDQFPYSGII